MARHPLYHRLAMAPSDILSAAVDGPQALESFQKLWMQLCTEFDEEARLDRVDEEVMMMANVTASIVSTLAGSLSHLENKANARHATLLNRLEHTLEGLGSPITSKEASSSPRLSLSDLSQNWLLENLHEPYPSSSVKKDLARSSGQSVDAVNAWFHNTRDHVGWTTVAHHHFKGSRSAMVDAARRAFITPDPTRPLSPFLSHAFSVVKRNLEKFLGIVPVEDPPDACQDTPRTVFHSGPEIAVDGERHGTPSRKEESKHLELPVRLPFSPCTLQPQNCDDDDLEEDMTPPPPIAGCKRRADSEPEVEQHSPVSDLRLMKRQRLNWRPMSVPGGTVEHTNISDLLPSDKTLLAPTASYPGSSCTLIASSLSSQASSTLPYLPTSSLTTQLLPTSHNSRKRRLSDASCDVSPKRPQNTRSGSCMQAVSDPFPRSTDETTQDSVLYESWYQTATDTPSEYFVSDLLNDPSPATPVSNTPWTDALCNEVPVLPQDYLIPSQKFNLSDDDFRAMVASGYDMSLNFIPTDQGILEMLSSLDDLFPLSFTGLSSCSNNPVQYTTLGVTSRTEDIAPSPLDSPLGISSPPLDSPLGISPSLLDSTLDLSLPPLDSPLGSVPSSPAYENPLFIPSSSALVSGSTSIL
uniref:B1 homeodomain mating type protein n=1 Tax=Heterobasidion occidentale TaxID=942053 RepID=S5RTQ5_9AGAM|nr:b1 homeodomain mating type protein [Heterobasidion occidentale]